MIIAVSIADSCLNLTLYVSFVPCLPVPLMNRMTRGDALFPSVRLGLPIALCRSFAGLGAICGQKPSSCTAPPRARGR